MSQNKSDFSVGQLSELTGAAFEIVTNIQTTYRTNKDDKKVMATYAPWAGLAQAKSYTRDSILKTLDAITAEQNRLPGLIKAVERIYEENELRASSVCGMLLRHKALIPIFSAMGALEGWSLKAVLVVKAETKSVEPSLARSKLPPVALAKDYPNEDARKPDITPALVDRAVAISLDEHLRSAKTITNWLLYLSVLGVRIVSGYPDGRRMNILEDPSVIHSLAEKTAKAQKAQREREEVEKLAKRRKRAEQKAARKAEAAASKAARQKARQEDNSDAKNTTIP